MLQLQHRKQRLADGVLNSPTPGRLPLSEHEVDRLFAPLR